MDNVRGHFAAFVAFKTKNQCRIIILLFETLQFVLNEIVVGSTSSEPQHPWISKIMMEPKKSRKNRFLGSI